MVTKKRKTTSCLNYDGPDERVAECRNNLLCLKDHEGPLPLGVTWSHIIGAGILEGIGFTMSLFISALSFYRAEFAELSKLWIIMGSLVSGVLGLLLLSLIKAPLRQAPNVYGVKHSDQKWESVL